MGMKGVSKAMTDKLLAMAHASDPPAPPVEIDEKAFDAAVVAEARKRGWKMNHIHYAYKSSKGFPDRIFVRERVIFAELKTESGKTTADQDNWIEWLRAAGQEVHLWRPSDWPQIVERLK